MIDSVRIMLLAILLLPICTAVGQPWKERIKTLPLAEKQYIDGIRDDWLIQIPETPTAVFRNEAMNEITLSNGIISRTFRLFPNAATTSLKVLQTQKEHIRAVKPEAVISVDGMRLDIGGLVGQSNLAFLYPDWLDNLTSDPLAFEFYDFKVGIPDRRMEWKQVRHHAPMADWPAPGIRLQMDYRLGDIHPEDVLTISEESSMGRKVIYLDDFSQLSREWTVHSSSSHERSSFVNEGKPGEIYTPNNTAVFAEYSLPSGTGLVETSLDVGTDKSGLWGPGIALLWQDRSVKFNLRPGNEAGTPNTGAWRFIVFDGQKENTRAGGKDNVDFNGSWLLRIRIDGQFIHCEAKPKDGKWKTYQSIDNGQLVSDPQAVRVGKLGAAAAGVDHEYPGEMIRMKINSFAAYSNVDENEILRIGSKLEALKNIKISVNYELYDHVPVMSKWLTLKNGSSRDIKVDQIISEYLGIADHNPYGGYRGRDDLKVKPNIHFETDYAFSGMKSQVANGQAVHWGTDQAYVTQISWVQDILNTMRIYPLHGYHIGVQSGDSLESIRTFILPFDSFDKERNGLAIRRMYRTIAPWITENPLMFHTTRSNWEEYTNAVDQAAQIGYEMVNFSFGSGFNAEDDSEENYEEMKKYAAYAESRGIKIGTYSLLASRRIDDETDVVNPKTEKPGGFSTFGNSPCLASSWGKQYFAKMYKLFRETGFMTFTHDGSYPGDVCASSSHPGHDGLGDSQYQQWKIISDFYKWCKGQGVYLRIPDFYFLNGGNQCGIGYRENNWSLPRRHQLIHTRQNIFDGTWESTPSMRWSFIPLAQYHGGGSAATIEPLHQHLDHYEMMLVSNLGMGIQSALRGPRLYDTEETKGMVTEVVSWFKKYRTILESDILHLRRADGRDVDYMLHVNPQLREKGLLLVFNPTDRLIRKKISVPLYYTGLSTHANVREKEGPLTRLKLDRKFEVELEIAVEPNWYNWYVFEN
ncbi:MAG: hypothetical protein HKN87_08400 [Saprospiraceae bacterium]|nr:hypothetical protein [Saprospiraceae bacterium]